MTRDSFKLRLAMATGLAMLSMTSTAPASAQDGNGRGRVVSIGGGIDLTRNSWCRRLGIGPLPYFDIP